MKTKIQIFLLLLAGPVVLLAQVKPPAQSGPIAITHVTVIDATGAPAQPDMTVVVRGNRITEIGKKVGVPGGAKVVDGTGKYLIPGLWDMHIHIHRHDENVLLLANGVTGVRLMGGVPEYHKMQKEIESGDLLGPRYTIASRLIDGIDATGRKLLPPRSATPQANSPNGRPWKMAACRDLTRWKRKRRPAKRWPSPRRMAPNSSRFTMTSPATVFSIS